MGKLLLRLRGYALVRVEGASPDWALNRLAKENIPFWSARQLNPMAVELCLFTRDLSAARLACERAMCQMLQEKTVGAGRSLRGLLRPVLLMGLLLTAAMVVLLPQFVLHFSVSGNETVPSGQILRTLESLNVGVGIHGPEIKPKWIKDHMLNLLPELQWITVTQNGCLGQVVVRERPETPEVIDRKAFANVVASRSGLIVSQSIFAGQAVKEPGDIVLKGELLVSGVVDLERVFTLEYAQAEIFARTWYEKTAVMPGQLLEKVPSGQSRRAIWFEFGRKRIKIFGNSGISTACCDKMIDRKNLSLPGGYELPIALLIETCIPCETRPRAVAPEYAEKALRTSVCGAVLSQTKAGELLRCETSLSEGNGVYQLTLMLECREMIAETAEIKWNKED